MNNKLTNKDILGTIAKEYAENDAVLFQTSEGVIAAPINTVIEQPYEDILYSLNRGFSDIYSLASQADYNLNGIYSGANKTRFINDLASSYIIKALKEKIDELKKENEELTNHAYEIEKEFCWAQRDSMVK